MLISKTKVKAKMFISKLSLLANSFWAIPFVLVVRFIRPWRVVKFGTFASGRIGHFAADSSIRFAEYNLKVTGERHLYYLPSVTCNSFWSELVRRNFFVRSWVRYLLFWNRVIPGGSFHQLETFNNGSRDIHGSFYKSKKFFQFTHQENAYAKDWLRQFGWSDGDPFVLLLIRDSKYLACDPLHGDESDVSYKKWDYHSYRNTEIDSYIPAMEWLASQGAFVLRMGSITDKPLVSDNSKLIDYSFRNDKSAFLDVWLFANTTLCITTGSGPDMISSACNRPMLVLNYTPISHCYSWSHALHAPKLLYHRNTQRLLTMREYLSHSFLETELYDQANIQIQDLSRSDILAITQECWNDLHEKFTDDIEHNRIQDIFWRIIKNSTDDRLNSWIHPRARISLEFLKLYPTFMDLT